ncbi:50S ribosomal protein L30 [Dongia deserti]|uniref:50S ribosomal protein L30 n=1 Tax=Dongia deserti TaxID=2268030 RepID=UPI000E654BD9|nr:50S ribosomal protein L30 [Dongia deserti]
MSGKLKITQIGSPIGRKPGQRDTLRGLGLDKMHRSNEVDDTPSIRGMLRKVGHLVRIEPAK